jgi:hypothetical protein
LELGRVASRTLNQRHVIANDIGVRRAVDALNSCTNLQQFCQILQQCLEPIGFDGFGLHLTSELPVDVEISPFDHIDGSKLQFFWNHPPTTSETNWSLTFSLMRGNGNALGGFTLYRRNAASPLWLDLDVLATTGFLTAIGAIVERTQDFSFIESTRKQSQKAALKPAGGVAAPGAPRSVAVPSSG